MREKTLQKRISQVLEETSAPDYIKQSYQHDPARAATRTQEGHHVVVTTSPLGIAGCSTGTGWSSCMNLEGGSNSHYLPHESENGTHVAYLVPHDDEGALKFGEPDKPIARISLRPFHASAFSYNGASDTIFRPSKQKYGADSADFRSAIENWANKAYPARPGETYNLNQHVYRGDDYDSLTFPTNEELKRRIDANRSMSFDAVLPKASIDYAIDYAKEKYRGNSAAANKFIEDMATHKNLDASHVSKLLSMDYTDVRPLAVAHGDKFSTSEIEKFHNKNRGYIAEAILSSKKLPDSVLDDLSVRDYHLVRKNKLKTRHIDKLVDALINDQSVGRNLKVADFVDQLSGDHITKLINHAPAYAIHLADAKNYTKEHYDAMPKNNLVFPTVMAKSKHATLDDIGDDRYSGMKISALMANPHLSEDDNKKLKDILVEKIRNSHALATLPAMDDVIRPHDITKTQTIPEKISRHFEPRDYSRIANKAMTVPFADKDASNKYLDAVHKNISYIDNYISDHIKNKQATDPTYDPAFDRTVSSAKKQMLNQLDSYHNNLKEHIDHHVKSESTIKDMNEFDSVLGRIHHLDSLNNYNRHESESDSGHYDDHFGDIKSDMDSLYNRSN